MPFLPSSGLHGLHDPSPRIRGAKYVPEPHSVVLRLPGAERDLSSRQPKRAIDHHLSSFRRNFMVIFLDDFSWDAAGCKGLQRKSKEFSSTGWDEKNLLDV